MVHFFQSKVQYNMYIFESGRCRSNDLGHHIGSWINLSMIMPKKKRSDSYWLVYRPAAQANTAERYWCLGHGPESRTSIQPSHHHWK